MTRRGNQIRRANAAALLWEQIHRIWGDRHLPLFMGTEEWKQEERRVHPRVPCFFLVDYATRDCFYRDFVRNISAGGLFVESRKLPIGPEVTMVLCLSDPGKPVKITGQVAWIDRDGIGVRFRP